MCSLQCLSEKMLIHNMHIVYLFYSYTSAHSFLLANLHSPLSSFCFTLFPSSPSCQLAFRKKRKLEKSPLCEEFLERASRPQELINIELLDVSRDSITSLDLKVDLFKSIYLLFFFVQELSNIHDLYDKLKMSVTSKSEQNSANLIRKDLVPQLRSTVVDFYKWQQRKVRLL